MTTTHIDLDESKTLGHWTTRDGIGVCEFQVGSTMIYVHYDQDHPMEARLAMAQSTIDAAFAERDDAARFARSFFEEMHPEFWKAADRVTLKQRPLIAYGLFYRIGDEVPTYEISWHPTFQPEHHVIESDFEDEEELTIDTPDTGPFVRVRRIGPGRFEWADDPHELRNR